MTGAETWQIRQKAEDSRRVYLILYKSVDETGKIWYTRNIYGERHRLFPENRLGGMNYVT